MEAEAKRVRLQVMVTPEVSAKVDDLAGRLHLSRSEFGAALIVAALDDQEWLIKLVTSEFMEPAVKAVKWMQSRSWANLERRESV